MPHCVSSDAGAHHHEHHIHTETDQVGSGHEHIHHQNHYDDNVLDLIVCLFSESEHNDDGCCDLFCLSPKVQEVPFFALKKVKEVASTLLFYSNDRYLEIITLEITFLEVDYLSPPLAYAPHRGPPFFSC